MACCEAHWAGISTPRTKRKPGTKLLSRLLHCAKWSAELIRLNGCRSCQGVVNVALCQMVGRTHPAVSRASSDQALDCLEKRRAGCGFPSGTRVRGRSRKALCPKSLARYVRAKPPGSRAARRATTPRREVPFSCRD